MREGEPKFEEEKQESERTSGLMRVAGGSPDVEKEILGEIKEKFENQQKFDGEKEKTPEEIEIINGVLKNLPIFIKKYGGIMPPFRVDNIHLGDYSELDEDSKKRIGNVRGAFKEQQQTITVVIDSKNENNLVFANRLVHELIHFCGFQSATLNKESQKLSQRTSGLGMSVKDGDKKGFYFVDINEALTEELVKRFDKEYFTSIPELSEDIKYRDKRREKSNKGSDLAWATMNTVQEESGMFRSTLRTQPYMYKNEREKLWGIINEIREKNPEQFESEEEVFDVFARAHFTGKRLEMARVLEKTYGKGSFRKLGEETKSKRV